MTRNVLVALGLGFAVLGTACRMIGEDEVGVVTRFGTLSEEPVGPGVALHLPPIREVEVHSTAIQELEESVPVAARERLIVRLDLSLRFRVDPDQAPRLQMTWGTRPVDVLVAPMLRHAARAVVGNRPLQGIHADRGREEIARKLEGVMRETLDDWGIALVDVRVRDVKLPPSYLAAHEQKLPAARGAPEEGPAPLF